MLIAPSPPAFIADFALAGRVRRRPGLLLLIVVAHLALFLSLGSLVVRPTVSAPTSPLAVSLLSTDVQPRTQAEVPTVPVPATPLPAAPALPIPVLPDQASTAELRPRPTALPSPEPVAPAAASTGPVAPSPEGAVPRSEVTPAIAAPAPPPPPPARPRLSGAAVQYRVMPPAQVPRASRRVGESGTVWLRVVVDPGGVPVAVSVQRSSGFARLDEQALWAMRQARFTPHLENGRPVEVEVIAPIEYPAG